MAKVSRPPVLRIGHQLAQVLLEGIVVERLESLSIAKVLAVRVGDVAVLAQNVGLERLGPPLLVSDAVSSDVGDLVRDGALALRHVVWCC